MSIDTTIPSLGTVPQTTDPINFDPRADSLLATELPAFRTAVNTWGGEANALAASMNSIAAGTALSIPYTFSTTITDADPGAGILRLGNATQNAATVIRADIAGSDGSTWTSVLDLMDDSTSTVKGLIMLQALADGTKWLMFSVSALASPAGYKNITVANVASSAANPFSNGESLVLKFTRNGDKGDTGDSGGTPTLGTPVASTSGTSIDFTGIPAGTKQVTINFSVVVKSGTGNVFFQLGDSGGVETTGYDSAGSRLSATSAVATATSGFIILSSGVSSYIYSGSIVLTLLNSSTNLWVASGVFGAGSAGATFTVGGSKALSAALDRVRITSSGGAETFSAGSINIMTE
jgi:hypothetical protein